MVADNDVFQRLSKKTRNERGSFHRETVVFHGRNNFELAGRFVSTTLSFQATSRKVENGE